MCQDVSACIKTNKSMQTDLISHGSQQVSDWVSFICPEPPQVWKIYMKKCIKKPTYDFVILLTLCGHVCVCTCLQRHRDVHPPVGSDHCSSCSLQFDHNRTVCWFLLYTVTHILNTYTYRKKYFPESTHRHLRLDEKTEKLTKANKAGKIQNPGIYSYLLSVDYHKTKQKFDFFSKTARNDF